MNTDDIIPKGYDRDVDYVNIKTKLLNEYNIIFEKSNKNMKDVNKLIYLVISMIQLRNGSRISEAIKSFYKFLGNTTTKIVIVKVSKTGCIRYSKKKQDNITSKALYRKIMFPNWIDIDILDRFNDIIPDIQIISIEVMRKRVLKYLLTNFDCNTHSLRYACINYLLYIEKRPINDVAKFVGYVDTNMLVRYTQQKNTDSIFDINM